jgi:hypothetical protein
MKKILFIVLLFLSFIGNGQILIDSWSESNYTSDWHTPVYSTYVAQSFYNSQSSSVKITSCKFYITPGQNSYPAGNIYAYLYAMTGIYGSTSHPTGSALAISDPVDATTLWNQPYALITFTFSGANQFSMSALTHYCICFVNTISSYQILVGYGGTSHPGNASYLYGSTWYMDINSDLCFYVYGTIVTTSISKVNGILQASIAKVDATTIATIKKINGIINQ